MAQRGFRFAFAAVLVVVLVIGFIILKDTRPVSAQDILNRAYAQLNVTESQDIQHRVREVYQNLQLSARNTGNSPTEYKNRDEGYLDPQTGQYRGVTIDLLTGLISRATGYDGTYIYESGEAGSTATPLVVYRTPQPRGWREIYEYTAPATSIDQKSQFNDAQKDPYAKLLGQQTWVDGRDVYVLRSANLGKMALRKWGVGESLTGFTDMYFDVKSYRLVESRTSIEQDGKETVIYYSRQLVDETLPRTTQVDWTLSDLKGIAFVDDPRGQKTGPWLEQVSQHELASRIQSAYVLHTVPEGFTEVIAASMQDSAEKVYTANYRDTSGKFFLIGGPSNEPNSAVDNIAEVYTTRSGLKLSFLDLRSEHGETDLGESVAIVTSPNAKFTVSSNLPAARVKKLAEQLVLAR